MVHLLHCQGKNMICIHTYIWTLLDTLPIQRWRFDVCAPAITALPRYFALYLLPISCIDSKNRDDCINNIDTGMRDINRALGTAIAIRLAQFHAIVCLVKSVCFYRHFFHICCVPCVYWHRIFVRKSKVHNTKFKRKTALPLTYCLQSNSRNKDVAARFKESGHLWHGARKDTPTNTTYFTMVERNP